MDAVVTIKATVAELDTLREALASHKEQMLALGKTPGLATADRQAANAKAAQASGLLGKLS